jgi:hypothetical protein
LERYEKVLFGDGRALSPFTASVILAAVVIVVAFGVAYWTGSIAGIYTRFPAVFDWILSLDDFITEK